MIEVNKPITVNEQQVVEVEKTATRIYFHSINENKDNRYLETRFSYMDDNDQIIKSQSIILPDDKYDLLMSESPEFALGKPANEYREVDLYYVMTAMGY